MNAETFLQEMDALKAERLAIIVGAGQSSVLSPASGDAKAMLQVALANEINACELAAAWTPSTPEVDVKLAFARQSGDEAGHFELVGRRLAAFGFDLEGYRPPGVNPLFEYLSSLSSTVERVAAGLYTLESIAYAVNQNFMDFCDQHGDAETVRIYHDYIQPDERRHYALGRQLLAKYATGPGSQARAREAVGKVLDIAIATRAQAAARLGTACLPGC
jgi:uncharacterized ferritin-like protein (DUF455 family)